MAVQRGREEVASADAPFPRRRLTLLALGLSYCGVGERHSDGRIDGKIVNRRRSSNTRVE